MNRHVIKLGEIARLSQGIQIPIGKQSPIPESDEYVRFIRIVDYTQNTEDVRYVKDPGLKYYVNETDIVMVRYGPIGVVGRGKAGVIANNMFKVTPDETVIDKLFLFYCLSSETLRNQLIQANTSTTMPAITFTMVKDLDIPLPPLEEQQRIAGILSAYDELIENSQRRIQILETMARALYREWFIHFRYPGSEPSTRLSSHPSPRGRRDGDEGAKPEKTKITNGLPDGWELTAFGEIYNTGSGGTPSRKRPEYFEGGSIDWIKSKELKDGFIFSTEEHITEQAVKKSSAKIFPADTVLIALYGATIGRLGILASEAATNQACCAVLQKHPAFGREFAFLTLFANRDRIIGLRLGAAQQNISQVILRNMKCVKPTDKLASQFSKRTAPIFDGILTLQRQIQNLRQTRDLLLPRLLSGQINLGEVEG